MPTSTDRYIDMPAEVRARMYVDYLIDCHIIAYESRKAYDDAVAYLADQIRTEL